MCFDAPLDSRIRGKVVTDTGWTFLSEWKTVPAPFIATPDRPYSVYCTGG